MAYRRLFPQPPRHTPATAAALAVPTLVRADSGLQQPLPRGSPAASLSSSPASASLVPDSLDAMTDDERKANEERLDKANEIIHAFIRNGSELQVFAR